MIAVRKLKDLTAAERERILRRPSIVTPEVIEAAAKIIADVRGSGDASVRKYSKQFDKADLKSFEATPAEFEAAAKAVPQQDQLAIRSMIESVSRYHKADVAKPFTMTPVPGIQLGKAIAPFETAGLYVPGGLAAYPSSLVMAAVPAGVAGVKKRILCTPPGPNGAVPPAILVAAKLCGVDQVFKIGGVQAIAAMAYGTESVPRAEIIVGPGNKFVTAAKKLVAGDVAIDFLAGPTEVLVLSDGDSEAMYLAADLIAQAEHDPLACCVLVTTSDAQAKAVGSEIGRQAPTHPRSEIIRQALQGQGALLVAETLDAALAFVNAYAPEHLVIACRNPMKVMGSVRHAGACFLGSFTPVAIGDYGVGPNAILPTLGEARRFAGLSANTFLKGVTYAMLTREGLEKAAPPAVNLAKLEGLDAHRASIEMRLK